MSASFKISISKKEWKSVSNFIRKHPQALDLAMKKSLLLLQGRIRVNLSGPSHTRFPGNGNPYPGTLTGRMKNSINAVMTSTKTKVRGVVGPNTEYAEKQDRMRPYLKPTLAQVQAQITKNFQQAYQEAMRG